jgi:hypothetical protein
MPWKECSVMDERVKFVARRLAGEAMADLCREFGISRSARPESRNYGMSKRLEDLVTN